MFQGKKQLLVIQLLALVLKQKIFRSKINKQCMLCKSEQIQFMCTPAVTIELKKIQIFT